MESQVRLERGEVSLCGGFELVAARTDLEDIGAPAVLGAPFPLNSCQKASARNPPAKTTGVRGSLQLPETPTRTT